MTQIQDVTRTKNCTEVCFLLFKAVHAALVQEQKHTHVNNGVDSTLSLVWLIRSLLFQSTPIKKLSVDIFFVICGNQDYIYAAIKKNVSS